MKVTVRFLKPYRDIVGRNEIVLDVKRASVRSILKKMCVEIPELRKEVFDERGEVEVSLNVIVNDKPVTSTKELDKALKDGDVLTLFMAVSGG